MHKNPLISVIIPLYNKERSIYTTIQSVLDQSFKYFELIIINDGSTDNSLKIAQSFDDDRIRIVSKKNEGVSAARNYGVHLSKTSWIFFLDADDLIYKECLDIFTSFINNESCCDIYLSNYDFKAFNGTIFKGSSLADSGLIDTKEIFKKIYFDQLSFRAGALLIQKNILLKHFFDTLITVNEDNKLWYELIKKYNVFYINKSTHLYIKEFSELSEGVKPLTKDYCYYLDFTKSDDLYLKKIKQKILLGAILKRILKKHFKDTFILFLKYPSHIPSLIVMYLKNKINGIIKR